MLRGVLSRRAWRGNQNYPRRARHEHSSVHARLSSSSELTLLEGLACARILPSASDRSLTLVSKKVPRGARHVCGALLETSLVPGLCVRMHLRRWEAGGGRRAAASRGGPPYGRRWVLSFTWRWRWQAGPRAARRHMRGPAPRLLKLCTFTWAVACRQPLAAAGPATATATAAAAAPRTPIYAGLEPHARGPCRRG